MAQADIVLFDQVNTDDAQYFYQIELKETQTGLFYYIIHSLVSAPNPDNPHQLIQNKDILEISELYDYPKLCWEEGHKKYEMIVMEAKQRLGVSNDNLM